MTKVTQFVILENLSVLDLAMKGVKGLKTGQIPHGGMGTELMTYRADNNSWTSDDG